MRWRHPPERYQAQLLKLQGIRVLAVMFMTGNGSAHLTVQPACVTVSTPVTRNVTTSPVEKAIVSVVAASTAFLLHLRRLR
jgi:hypothetical protein